MLTLSSDSFEDGEPIPPEHAPQECGGQGNSSPALSWQGEPEGTGSYTLIVEDPDAPIEGAYTHWIAYDLPAHVHRLPEDASRKEGEGRPHFLQGRNDAGDDSWSGPCPPRGETTTGDFFDELIRWTLPAQGETHRYFFYLYAVDQPGLGLPEGATADQAREALEDHTLAQAQLQGVYTRS